MDKNENSISPTEGFVCLMESSNLNCNKNTSPKYKKVESFSQPAPTKASLARENFIRNKNSKETNLGKPNKQSTPLIRHDSSLSKASNKTVVLSSNASKLQPMVRGKSLNALLIEEKSQTKTLQKEHSKLSEKTMLPQISVSMKSASSIPLRSVSCTTYPLRNISPKKSCLKSPIKLFDSKKSEVQLEKLESIPNPCIYSDSEPEVGGEFDLEQTVSSKKSSEYYDLEFEVGGEFELNKKSIIQKSSEYLNSDHEKREEFGLEQKSSTQKTYEYLNLDHEVGGALSLEPKSSTQKTSEYLNSDPEIVEKFDLEQKSSTQKTSEYFNSDHEVGGALSLEQKICTQKTSEYLNSVEEFGLEQIYSNKSTCEYYDSELEVGGALDLEQKALKDLESMELKLSKTIETCIDIVRGTNNTDLEMFLRNMEKRKPLENLQLLSELIKKLSEESMQQRKVNKKLNEKIKELHRQNTLFIEQIEHYKISLENEAKANEKIFQQDQQISQLKTQLKEKNAEIKEYKIKSDEEISKIKISLTEYNHKKKEAENLQNELQNLHNRCNEQHVLKIEAEKLKNQKMDLEKALQIKTIECEEAKYKLQINEAQIIKLRKEVAEILDSRNRGSEKIASLEREVSELQKILEQNVEKRNLKRKLLKVEAEEAGKDVYETGLESNLKRCKQSEVELERLRKMLNEAKTTIMKLQTEHENLKTLLAAKIEHIKSLESTCSHQRAEIDRIFVLLSEKNRVIGELHNELRVKNEDFQNMFSTLGQKQLDMNMEMQNICRIKESYECSQRLRIAHEEKILRLEQEIEQLKTLRSKKQIPTSPHINFRDHKKSSKTINVKKYTT